MAITLPSFVAPNELIQSAWGNGVVNALDELDDEKLNLAGGEMTGALTINRPALGTSLILKAADEIPRLRWQSQAGTDLASLIGSASALTLDTQSNNTFFINAPTTIETGGGSNALNLKAVTETPRLTLESIAGTDLLTLTGSSSESVIESFDDLTFRGDGFDIMHLIAGTRGVHMVGELEIDGALNHDGTSVGFYGTAPIAKQTGVAVTAAAIHAALVALGLIAA